jgi:hypothetical protein
MKSDAVKKYPAIKSKAWAESKSKKKSGRKNSDD